MKSLSIPSRPSSRRRGFTLTELAIVIGIIGLVLGAVWIAGGMVSNNNRLQTAQQEAALIFANYRTLFGQHAVDIATGTDITCDPATINGIADNFFPPTMGGTSCAPASYPASYPKNPWAGYVRVLTVQNTGIGIEFGLLPQSACISYASSAPNSTDVVQVVINAVAAPLPVTVAYAAKAVGGCVAGNGNSVRIVYKIP